MLPTLTHVKSVRSKRVESVGRDRKEKKKVEKGKKVKTVRRAIKSTDFNELSQSCVKRAIGCPLAAVFRKGEREVVVFCSLCGLVM